jgi:hypothetical protein
MIFNKTAEILARKGFPSLKIFSSWPGGIFFFIYGTVLEICVLSEKKQKQATIF